MSSSDRISERFNMFYDEIDTQMSRLQNSDSIFSQFSMQSDDAKMLNRMEKGEIPMADVDNLIKTAKEFDSELKSYIEKNNLRKKVSQRKVKTQSVKSKFPPIWNDTKLSKYIESIVDEVFVPCGTTEEEVLNEQIEIQMKPQTPAPVVRPILKTEKSKPSKRNVATNVKFQIHPPKVDNVKYHEHHDVLKKTNKKVQTMNQKQPQFKLDTASGTLFPCRTERLMDTDGSAVVNVGESLKIAAKPKDLRPQTAPEKLKYSPITVTSTAGRNSNTKQQNADDDDVVDVIDSNLATANTKNAKQMTTRLFPVLSIKGSCSIQKIYQLEISPSLDDQTEARNDETRLNTKLAKYVYEPSSKKLSAVHDPPETVPIQPSIEISQPSAAVVIEDENRTEFFDFRDVNKILKDYGVHLRNGKVHVVVESGRRRKSSRKTRPIRTLKPSTLRKSIDELETTQIEAGGNGNMGREKINICKIPDGSEQKRKEEEITEKDSSMSSSITDDGKIRQILKINRDGERRHQRENSSSGSYPESSLNVETSAQPPVEDAERAVAENFESIYKLIEETFQPEVGAEATAETSQKVKEIDDGMNEMRDVIKLSEENIKRAGMMLQKYQKPTELPTREKPTADSLTGEEISKKLATVVQDFKDTSAQFSHREVQTTEEVVEAGTSYQNFSTGLNAKSHKKETVDSCAQTSEDKLVQTDGNMNWKSQQYFGNVYENYSNFNHIKFHQSPAMTASHKPFSSSHDPCNCVGCERKRNFSSAISVSRQQGYSTRLAQAPSRLPGSIYASPKLPVPYNPIYSDDDEVMKAANKFLRSVEKRKSRNADSDITSSEISSSNGFSPQKVYSRKSSSSTSTTSSSLLNNAQQIDNKRYPVPRARSNLQDKLQKAADGIASIEQRLEDIQPLTGETQSNVLSSSVSPQFHSPDSQYNQDLLDRYLSEGEVLSQGEIQFRLSDDDDLPDDLF